MAIYTPVDSGWSAIYAEYLSQGAPGVVTYNGVVYQRVFDGENGIIFTEVENRADKTSFGTPDDKWRGHYPPITEESL